MKNFWSGKNGPMLIAEIGVNHEGSFDRAKKILDLAFLADVDVIKFQIYKGSLICNKKLLPVNYKRMRSFELSQKEHLYLADKCKERGFKYSSSIWNKEDLRWINKKMDFFKVGSGDLTNVDLIKEICKFKKPIILSTGLANFQEIKKIVNFIKKQGCFYEAKDNLAILQCTSSYPASPNDLNLNFLYNLKKFGYTVGYSHHNLSMYPLEIAYTLGAKILEFHFTDSRQNRKFHDHKISLTNNMVQKLIKNIRFINTIQGQKKIKTPTTSELNNIINFRRGLYLNKNKKKNSIVTDKDIICLRPNSGICASKYFSIINKKTTRNIKKLEVLSLKDFNSK